MIQILPIPKFPRLKRLHYAHALLIEDDCLRIMEKMPDHSVNLILCDLPYGTTQNKWDSVLPLDKLWSEYSRILAPNGAIVLMGQGPFTAELINSNLQDFKYKLVWVKSKATNFLNAKKQPLRRHEDICVFYPKQPTYNPVMTEGKEYDKGIRKDQLTGSYGDFNPVRVKSKGGRYPTDVIYCKTAESEGTVWHSTQKPVELGRYLIRTYTNPGDIVFDNAFGSGSFIVSAIMENRKAIGIEINHAIEAFKMEPLDLIQVASKRLNEYIGKEKISTLRRGEIGDNVLSEIIYAYLANVDLELSSR